MPHLQSLYGMGEGSIRAGLGDKSDLMSVSPIFLPQLNTTKEGFWNKWLIVLISFRDRTGFCFFLTKS